MLTGIENLMHKETLADLRHQAQKITESGKPAKIVWSELRTWASNRGPLAIKSAVMEFITSYHGSSELAVLLPELIRSSTFSPYEQKALVELANHKVSLIGNSMAPTLSARPLLPTSSSRPDLALFLNPRAKTSLLHSEFGSDPRNAIFALKEKTQISVTRPKMAEGRNQHQNFDPSTLQSYSMAFDSRGISSGESLLSNLTGNLRSHSFDGEATIKPKRVATRIRVKFSRKSKAKRRRR